MQAVILAAGVGGRLGEHTKEKPKCLLEVGGKPIIKHQIEMLSDHGIGKILLIVGYKENLIREAVGDSVDFIVNERYRETNSLYSLSLARDWVEGPFILMNCDILFHPDILDRLLSVKGSALAYDSTSIGGREQTKVALSGNRVLDLGKDLPGAAAKGESLGILKFDAEGARALFESVEEQLRLGQENSWGIEAIRATCSEVAIAGVNVAGLPWVEVDFPVDLDKARREVWPGIENDRSRMKKFWRKARWPAAGVAGILLIMSGWMSSSSVGPASIDWESVKPLSAPKVFLSRTKGVQEWWLTDRGDSLIARLGYSDKARLEFRALMPERFKGRGRYVIEVSVDGTPVDWKIFHATPDTSVHFPGFIVGDRDRVTLDLPGGDHTVAVKLLAGTSDKMLTRIRKPE